jgi:hypothetical protein
VWKCICVRNEKQRAWPGERHNGSSSIPVVAGDPVRAVVDALVSNLFWFPAKAGHGQERGEHASTATRLTPTAQWAARVNATVGGIAYSHNRTPAWASRAGFGALVCTWLWVAGLRP